MLYNIACVWSVGGWRETVCKNADVIKEKYLYLKNMKTYFLDRYDLIFQTVPS